MSLPKRSKPAPALARRAIRGCEPPDSGLLQSPFRPEEQPSIFLAVVAEITLPQYGKRCGCFQKHSKRLPVQRGGVFAGLVLPSKRVEGLLHASVCPSVVRACVASRTAPPPASPRRAAEQDAAARVVRIRSRWRDTRIGARAGLGCAAHGGYLCEVTRRPSVPRRHRRTGERHRAFSGHGVRTHPGVRVGGPQRLVLRLDIAPLAEAARLARVRGRWTAGGAFGASQRLVQGAG